MAEPIFDRRAKLVAWFSDDGVIYSLKNQPIAHVANFAVFTYESRHLGYFDRGFFRDRKGRAIAFLREHSGGPLSAIAPSSVGAAPLLGRAPMPKVAPFPPPMPMAGFVWSNLSWETFVAGRDLTQAHADAPSAVTSLSPA